MEPVLKRMGMVDESMFNGYEVGTRVKIITGPLEGTEGVITSLDKKTGAVQIKTLFFGRETVVDQDFSDIERI